MLLQSPTREVAVVIPRSARPVGRWRGQVIAEFLYRCVQSTIEDDLPREARFLEAHDRFVAAVQDLVDMPGTTVDLLFRFLRQARGKLSQRARSREFKDLTEDEVERVEELFRNESDALLSD